MNPKVNLVRYADDFIITGESRELLENHIRYCVARDIREGKDEVIDELMGTLKKLMK